MAKFVIEVRTENADKQTWSDSHGVEAQNLETLMMDISLQDLFTTPPPEHFNKDNTILLG